MNRSSAAPSPFRLALLLLGMMMAALLSACGGGGGQVGLPTGIALYTSAPAGVALAAGASSSYTVGGGNPLYSVSSSNKDVATATVSGTSLTITGVGAGSATISVTDAVGASVQVPVTVSGPVTPPVIPPGSLFTTAGGAVTVGVGANASFGIGGGKPGYAVSSSNAAVASATVSGANFTVSGVGAGSAQIIVTDSAGTSLTLEVTVGAGTATLDLYTTAPNSVTIAVGAVGGYLVGGGKPAYAVSSSNAGVARVALSGTSFTITGVAAGSAQVVVFDASGDSIEIAVSIGAGGTVTPLFTTAPDDVRIAVGATAIYGIGGGKSPYAVSTSNAAVARVAINGTDFIITGVSSGTAQIAVFDASGDSQTMTVTIGAGSTSTPLYTTAASSLTLGVGVAETYAIGGGKPAYAVTSNNAGVVKVALNGTDFTLTGMAAGTAQVTVTDSAGATQAIAVTVGAPVTVTPLYTTAPGAITLAVNASDDFLVGGGKPAYKVSTDNAAVAKAAIVGGDLTVTGIAAGTAHVTVTDAAGDALTLSVTVGLGNVSLFTTAPGAINVGLGGSGAYTVGGGKPAYSVSTSDASVASVALNGSTFVVTGASAGTAKITVGDAAGATVAIDVTVSAGTGQSLFTTAPGSVTVGVGATASFTAGGGKPAYTASTSNAAVATVTLSGSGFVITGVGPGAAQITVGDANGSSVPIAVTVPSGTGQSLFTTAPGNVSVAVGASGNYTAGGGSPAYSVSTSNAAVATVTLSGTSFVITGVSSGVAQVNVGDTTGNAVEILVTVGAGGGTPSLFTTAPGAITLGAGVSGTYAVAGGRPGYSVSTSDSAVATASLSGTTLTINGVSAGTAQIKVGDSGGDSVTINVTVGSGIPPSAPALYTTAAGSVTIAFGSTANYMIGGGAGGYVASSSDTSVAAVSIVGATLTVTPVSPGTATVTVFDAAASSVPINVTVTQTAPSAITVLPGEVTGNVGDSLVFLVSGGTPAYKITMSNSSIATVSPSTVSTDGGSFTINMINVGSTVATIVDAAGKSTTVPITVQQISTVLRLSPSALLVGENYSGAITLNIFGGTGPYRAFTSDQTLSSVSVVGSTLTLAVGSSGNRCIDPVSDDGTYTRFGTFDVTVTAVDSLGASATSVLTIKDNGAGLGTSCP